MFTSNDTFTALLNSIVNAHLLKTLSQKLQSQLEALSSVSIRCEEDKHSKSRMVQTALMDFIETSKQSRIDTDSIHKVLAKMYSNDLLVDSSVYEGAVKELVSNTSEKSSKEESFPNEDEKKLPPLFCENTVHHACLCSLAASTCTAADYRDFFNKKFPEHSLEEASLSSSQDREDVDRYLIARHDKVYYVAFQSEPLLSDWMEKFSSFEKGVFHCICNSHNVCIHGLLQVS